MTKKEKKWRRIYLVFLIFIYAIYIPVELFEFITEGGGFPITVIIVGVAYPIVRINHLKQIRLEQNQ